MLLKAQSEKSQQLKEMFEKMDNKIADFIGQFEMGSVLKKETTASSIVTFDEGP